MIFQKLTLILDARSFSSPWYWVIVLAAWTLAGRNVLGVPLAVIGQARRALREAPHLDSMPVLALLDWLSLQLPQHRPTRLEGILAVGLGAFVLTALGVIGFRFQFEAAQAMTLLLAPLMVVQLLQLRLAGQLGWVLESARLGQSPPEAAAEALRRMTNYRRLHMLISVAAVALTALWAQLWLLMHPNGL